MAKVEKIDYDVNANTGTLVLSGLTPTELALWLQDSATSTPPSGGVKPTLDQMCKVFTEMLNAAYKRIPEGETVHQHILMIKHVREATGCGLKDAKDFTEKYFSFGDKFIGKVGVL